MKKHFLLLGCLFLTSACNLGVSTPTADSAPTQTPLPTLEVVVAAPSMVPTETAVPTPEPPARYFTDEFDTPSPYWAFMQAGGTSTPLTAFDGALRIDISSPDTWLIGVHNAHTYSDVFVRAQTSVSPSGSVGLLCRYSEENGWYEFNTSNNGTYSVLLGQWLSPGVTKYIPIINDSSNQLTGSSSNEIGFFCQDNFLQLYVNGTLMRRIEVTNYGLTEGGIGITSSSFMEVPISAVFEWVSVSSE